MGHRTREYRGCDRVNSPMDRPKSTRSSRRRPSPRRQISGARKAFYYGGMSLMILGGTLFVSNFFIEDFDNTVVPRAVGGMLLLLVGSFLMSVGRSGAAGAGLILDPEQSRRDQEPWSRMKGGMVADGLDEAGVDLGRLAAARGEPEEEDDDFEEDLRRLHRLHQDGILTDEEYASKKAEILEDIG